MCIITLIPLLSMFSLNFFAVLAYFFHRLCGFSGKTNSPGFFGGICKDRRFISYTFKSALKRQSLSPSGEASTRSPLEAVFSLPVFSSFAFARMIMIRLTMTASAMNGPVRFTPLRMKAIEITP